MMTLDKIKIHGIHGNDRLTAGSIAHESLCVVKLIKMYDELVSAYKLRHEVFCEELGWVPPLESGLEVDQYDDKAVSFGVFNRHNTLMAYIRLISSKNTYMIEKDFSILVDPTHSIRKSRDTAETSRVCVASDFRNQTFIINSEIFDISMLLFKGVYLWCLENGIRYIYTVVELKMLRYLRGKGFPCNLIGKPITMPDGTRAAAVIMDWREFEAVNHDKRPNLWEWFSQVQPVPCLSR
jgi:N-acyl-L-homoserine lactone synthetase